MVLVVTGCGAEAGVSSIPENLDGKTVATRANALLEKQNPQLAPGALTCQKVRFKVGATSRCTRTVVFDDGRLVRSGATVTIDGVKDGGHLQVQVDDEPTEFGITGKAVFADLARQYAARYKVKPPTGSCPPYLAGKVGTTITCSLVHRGGQARGRGQGHEGRAEDLRDPVHVQDRHLTTSAAH